ncbi:outer membrane protein [uncultured Bradyrhizobium sp.]|uniref:outer membrane protein n=1 Tax=uncultured Bradyrhizobium sp. TaxID=199684 RepID=UPI0035CC8948
MKKILAGAAALLGTAVSAQAADMAVKAPYLKAPVAMVYDWTGFYIGVNAGVGIGRDYTRLAIPAGPSFEASYLNPQGGMGGGQVGYNWQVPNSFFGGLVFGVEADIQGTGLRDNYTCLLGCAVGVNSRFNQKLDWFGTVRGRVGIATGPVLTYVTAGWAYGSVKTTLTETIGTTGAFASNQNRGGWTWGSGIEASLGGNWTGKIEYLWFTLGDRMDAFTLNGIPQAMSTDIREQMFRVGLNYRIGGNGAAYVPPPASNWTGFYLGGNIGSGIGRDRTALSAAGTTEFFNLTPDGFNGGVQAGYNWQAANWVFGLEADIQGASQRDNRACVASCNPLTLFAAYDASLPWFGTVRGRVGYSVGSSLFYATGGYAYGGIKTKIAYNLGTGVGATEFSNTKGGWTVGGGIETPFTFLVGVLGNNWTSKTEYLYVDLGTQTGAFATPAVVGGPAAFVATNSTQVHEHIFRTGLNYHFNSSPVVAKY